MGLALAPRSDDQSNDGPSAALDAVHAITGPRDCGDRVSVDMFAEPARDQVQEIEQDGCNPRVRPHVFEENRGAAVGENALDLEQAGKRIVDLAEDERRQ